MCLVMAPAFAQRPAPSHMKSAHKTARPSRAAFAPVRVAGRVTLPDAKPAVGAQVYVRWVENRENIKTLKLETDAQGAFQGAISSESKLSGQTIQVTALLPGQGIVCQKANCASGGLEKLKLRLTPGMALTGRLIRPDGKPAANVPVLVESLTMPTPAAAPPVSPVVQNNVNGLDEGEIVLQERRQDIRQMPITGPIAAQFHTQTDAAGMFTLTGLPVGGRVLLQPGAGLLMAAGSLNVIHLTESDHQDAGLLVAVKPGRLKIHLLNKQTNKPIANGMVGVLPASVMLSMLTFGENGSGGESAATTNAKGDVEFKDLRPGDYRIFVEGRSITAHVDEEAAPPLQMTLRQGALRGRLLDSQGKPLAHVSIMALSGTPHRLTPDNNFLFFNQGEEQGIKTRADGSFTIARIPWGSPSVWIRAAQGNNLAEWTGSPDKLGSTLTLKMRKNAMITVTGHLIDPERRPLSKQKCATLHWLDSPRSTWFAMSHQISADAQGNFRVTGLERGEAFSVVTSPAFERGLQNGKAFESPRFTTVSAGQEQNLGDVMVHPVQDPGEIMTIYSDTDQSQQNRLSGLLPAPTSGDVAAARQTLARYQAALKSGDAAVLHELASHFSPGWSADQRDFLAHCSLAVQSEQDPLVSEKVRALPLVPRVAGALLLQFGGAEQDMIGSVDLGATIREMDMNPNFVFLAEQRPNAIGLTGVLHKEDGVWRVVVVPAGLMAQSAGFLIAERGSLTAQDKADFTRMAPPLDANASAEAEQAAQKYLKFWSQNRAASMQGLTAPASPLYATDLADYKARFAQRQDEGICPLTDADTAVLQPIDSLTVWDQKLLTGLSAASVFNPNSINSRPRRVSQAVTQQRQNNSAAPQDAVSFARRGDIAHFRYNAAGHWYLISLVRCDGQWTVLEPAFAM